MQTKLLRVISLIALTATLLTTGLTAPVSAAALGDDPQPTVTPTLTDPAVDETATPEDLTTTTPTQEPTESPTPEPTQTVEPLEASDAEVQPAAGNRKVFLPIVFGASPAVNVIKVQTGSGFACALFSSGGVKCWGNNRFGQLGNNTNNNSYTPVYVSGLTSGVKDISVGYEYACALTTDGRVLCWGRNDYGQLGNGSGGDQNTPVEATDLPDNIQAVAAGWYHACAVTSGGGAICWGNNQYGQVGNNTSGAKNVRPAGVYNLNSGVTEVTAGANHTCALMSNDEMKCWGYNIYGQLGDNSTTNRITPVQVYNLSSISQISAGSMHTCATTNGGSVRCWGWNYFGQLGNDSTTNSSTQVRVNGLTSGQDMVTTGSNFSCARSDGGGVKCWGNNSYGQLGNNSNNNTDTPVDVYNLTSGASQVSAKSDFACAVTTSGGVKCWGHNNYGQLGNQSTNNSSIPVDVKNLKD